jgi:hypothetical protein
MLAGWLFADLLLGLAVLFIASLSPVQRKPTPTPTFTATGTLTSTPTVTSTATLTTTATPTRTFTPTRIPTPTRLPESLDPVPFESTVRVNVNSLLSTQAAQKEREQTRLKEVLRQIVSPFADKRAGFVLTFGAADPAHPTIGNQVADQVNQVLRASSPAMFGQAVMESYHTLNAEQAQLGAVELRIYFFNR